MGANNNKNKSIRRKNRSIRYKLCKIFANNVNIINNIFSIKFSNNFTNNINKI